MGMFLAEVEAGLNCPEWPGVAHERRQSRESAGIVLSRPVTRSINRLNVDAFVGVCDQLLLEWRSFQVRFNKKAPGIICDRREIVAQCKFLGKHVGDPRSW